MKAMTPRNTLVLVLALSVVGGTALWLRPKNVSATPTPAPQVAATAEAVEPEAEPEAPEQSPTTATIVITTTPAAPAVVSWGRRSLGRVAPRKPLVLVRPRDSGPLDLMVRANGYLPVQTRAHTFSDHKLLVKLTPLENKSELLGYRAPLDAGVDEGDEAALNAVAAGDAGVAQGAVPAPASP